MSNALVRWLPEPVVLNQTGPAQNGRTRSQSSYKQTAPKRSEGGSSSRYKQTAPKQSEGGARTHSPLPSLSNSFAAGGPTMEKRGCGVRNRCLNAAHPKQE